MTQNMGSLDRMVRLVIGLVLLVAPLLNLPATWSIAWLAYASMGVGAILTVTAVIGVCPLYSALGIRT
ncbi:MAG: DUF2892 domain-containing protein [Paracoccaceae bacterium]|nr:DUF2892 domain-containing protein [Paracoccaceae bacterium]